MWKTTRWGAQNQLKRQHDICCSFLLQRRFGRSKPTDSWPPKDIWHSEPKPRARSPLTIEYDQSQYAFPTRSPLYKKRHDWLLQILGYYGLTEVRHRASLYLYRKCCLMSEHKIFWDTFDLSDDFRAELQVLALHMWIAKSRCQTLEQPEGSKLSKQTFWSCFEDLCYRFERHIVGLISKWEKDCQQVCFGLCLGLDNAAEDFPEDFEAYASAIWNNIYLKNKSMQYDILYLWSEYIERETKALQVVEDRDFILGYWEFGPIPTPEDLVKLRKLIEVRDETGYTGPCDDITKTYFGLYDLPQTNPHSQPDDADMKKSITCFFPHRFGSPEEDLEDTETEKLYEN